MGSLKDALGKAGFKETKKVTVKKNKDENAKKVDHTHQQHQNFCGSCSKTTPDVEHYENRQGRAELWLCCQCADDKMIDDNLRITAQSEYSRQAIFRRQFGRTKRFSKEMIGVMNPKLLQKEKSSSKSDEKPGKKTTRFNSSRKKF